MLPTYVFASGFRWLVRDTRAATDLQVIGDIVTANKPVKNPQVCDVVALFDRSRAGVLCLTSFFALVFRMIPGGLIAVGCSWHGLNGHLTSLW